MHNIQSSLIIWNCVLVKKHSTKYKKFPREKKILFEILESSGNDTFCSLSWTEQKRSESTSIVQPPRRLRQIPTATDRCRHAGARQCDTCSSAFRIERPRPPPPPPPPAVVVVSRVVRSPSVVTLCSCRLRAHRRGLSFFPKHSWKQ